MQYVIIKIRRKKKLSTVPLGSVLSRPLVLLTFAGQSVEIFGDFQDQAKSEECEILRLATFHRGFAGTIVRDLYLAEDFRLFGTRTAGFECLGPLIAAAHRRTIHSNPPT